MPLYADIAIPSVPRDTLSYGVPDGLADAVVPGVRVVVPLGRRYVTGYVVGTSVEAPAVAVKPVREALDARPSFIPVVRELCAWVGRYYVCSLGDALKAALPQGMDVTSERFVSLACGDEEEVDRAVGKSRTLRAIVDLLRTGEVMSEEAVARAVGLRSVEAQLRVLGERGIVQRESVVARPLARPRTVRAARLLPPFHREDKLRELMEIMEKRAPRQVNLLAALRTAAVRGRPTVPVPALLREARASSTALRALEEKEIVEILDEEVAREPALRYEEPVRRIVPTAEQRAALDAVGASVDAGGFAAYLLHGVTASGKTQVYIDAIRRARARERTALVLVPEIALTPQLVFRFRAAFGDDVAVLHSRLSIGERYDVWRRTRDGAHRIVVGVRSAVFAPLENVGLVVVDEEHDASYKQNDPAPRYHARDVATVRARMENAVVLLGSATPSAESWHNALAGKYALLDMPSRVDGAALPDIVPVDMLEARRQNRVSGAFSHDLLDGIRGRAARKEATIVLHNRRGYAPHHECLDCGRVEECDNCSIALVYHKDRNLLRCHYCGAARRAPAECPRCGGTRLEFVGAGTQRVEEDLRAAIPEARVIRMDLDTTRRKGAHDLILSAFGAGGADVLLGTQMVSKGLDFDRVTLVGVIAAEQSLLLPDFRAGERTFQILTQVAGRSGRGAMRGAVLIQATVPDHPILRLVAAHDYRAFIDEELRHRAGLAYPPYTRLVLLAFSGAREEAVREAAGVYHRILDRAGSFLRCHPPQPAIVKRINNRYRYHLLARADKRRDPDNARTGAALRAASEEFLRASKIRSVRLDVDVDPQSMM